MQLQFFLKKNESVLPVCYAWLYCLFICSQILVYVCLWVCNLKRQNYFVLSFKRKLISKFQAKPSRHLWIWGVSETITKDQLEAEFKKFGPLDDFRLLRDRNSALAEFRKIQDASAAVKGLNKKKIQGEELRVDFLRSQSAKRVWACFVCERVFYFDPLILLNIAL